ncbi:MAG: mycothiol synthase [Actinomycetota bacterium]|nr:mycothiol synthase [Actinomycetota bacterium]
MALVIARPDLLDGPTRAEVLTLVKAIETRDGEPPLSDEALVRLTSEAVGHLVARDGSDLVGYAQLDDGSAEIAADGSTALALLAAVETGGTTRLFWSHGRRSPMAEILARRGYEQVRVLHQLRLTLAGDLPSASLAEGVRVRAFVPGRDEQAWLSVNAAAFAEHPEQGRWTLADLHAREAEPWFDPSGFLLAERDGRLSGFHWTKVHGRDLGEVYVLGVDPAAQGLGLGKSLLVLGLARLAEAGCAQVLLYVDDDNTSAMRLYENVGFRSYDLDIQWRRGATDAPA